MFYWSFTMWWFVMSEDGQICRWSRWESTKTIFKQPKVFCKQNQSICINIVTNIVIPFGVSFELKKHNRWQRKQSQLIFDSTNWKWVSHHSGAKEQEKERGGGGRRDICHKHHKQRLCKIISTRVKFHFVSVFLEQFMYIWYFCGNIQSCKPMINY